jgi:hypothetical protein
MRKTYLSLLAIALLLFACKKDASDAEPEIVDIVENFGPEPEAKDPLAIPASEVTLFKLSTNYYKKYVMLGTTLENSIPIVAGPNVSDLAMQQAKLQCSYIANTPAMLNMLRQQRIFVVIFGNEEYPNVIPGWDPAWDATRYAGGYGPNAPGASCGLHMGDILNNTFDRYPNENIVIHEFGHAVVDFALDKLFPGFKANVSAIWNRAKTKGLWANTYAISNASEYWAEGVQSYFNLNAKGPEFGDGTHNHVSTRALLKTYDPEFYELLHSVYGDTTMPPDIK